MEYPTIIELAGYTGICWCCAGILGEMEKYFIGKAYEARFGFPPNPSMTLKDMKRRNRLHDEMVDRK